MSCGNRGAPLALATTSPEITQMRVRCDINGCYVSSHSSTYNLVSNIIDVQVGILMIVNIMWGWTIG